MAGNFSAITAFMQKIIVKIVTQIQISLYFL